MTQRNSASYIIPLVLIGLGLWFMAFGVFLKIMGL